MTRDDGSTAVGSFSLVYSKIFPEEVFGLTAAHNLCYDNEGKTTLFKEAYVLLEKSNKNTPKKGADGLRVNIKKFYLP